MSIFSPKIMLSLFAILFVSSLSAQIQSSTPDTLWNEISIQRGVTGSMHPDGQSSFNGYYTNIEYAHFRDEHWGYRTGISITNSLPGCSGLYTIPLKIAYRTNTYQTVDGYLNFNSFNGFFGSIISWIPSHAEFNGGVSLGFADGQTKPATSNYYKVNNPISLSIDLGMRLNLHIGRVNLFFAPQFSYVPTQNFVSYSNNGARKEYEPAFFGAVSVGIGWRY